MGRLRQALGCSLGTAALLLLLGSCQGQNASFANPRPASREAGGTNEELPPAEKTSNRAMIDSRGGEVEYRACDLVLPRGALTDALFIEIALPKEAPADVLTESAYQLTPDGLELQKEALLSITYYDPDIPNGKSAADLVIVGTYAAHMQADQAALARTFGMQLLVHVRRNIRPDAAILQRRAPPPRGSPDQGVRRAATVARAERRVQSGMRPKLASASSRQRQSRPADAW